MFVNVYSDFDAVALYIVKESHGESITTLKFIIGQYPYKVLNKNLHTVEELTLQKVEDIGLIFAF